MSEQPPINIGELKAEAAVPGGTINPTDLLEIFRPNNPANPAAGGNSLGGTAQEILAFVFGNISVGDTPVQTWTPSVTGSTTNPSFTGLVAEGRYVRLGRLVVMDITITWGSRSGGSGRLEVSFPPGVTPSVGRVGLPAVFLRGVTLSGDYIGVPMLQSAGVVYFRNGVGEAALGVDALAVGSGVASFSGSFIS